MLDILKKAGLNEGTLRLAYKMKPLEGRKLIRRFLIGPGLREDDLRRLAGGDIKKYNDLKADRDAWLDASVKLTEELLSIDDD